MHYSTRATIVQLVTKEVLM